MASELHKDIWELGRWQIVEPVIISPRSVARRWSNDIAAIDLEINPTIPGEFRCVFDREVQIGASCKVQMQTAATSPHGCSWIEWGMRCDLLQRSKTIMAC